MASVPKVLVATRTCSDKVQLGNNIYAPFNIVLRIDLQNVVLEVRKQTLRSRCGG